jgi:isopenicillin N synthase-like dioxygenase/tRNA(Arg) A34 adenosine deaminase TadA
MKVAIDESRHAHENGCMPFGAVLADEFGNIIVKARNGTSATSTRGGTGDVTLHAEMVLVKEACAVLNREDRSRCTLYSSTEPCVMCAGAIYWSGICRLVYGCSSIMLETHLSGPGGFDIDVRLLYGTYSREGTRSIEVVGPLLEGEAMIAHAASGIWPRCGEYLEGIKERGGEDDDDDDDDASFVADDAAARDDIDVEESLRISGLGSAPAVEGAGVVPIIDLRGPEDEVAERLWHAATTVGFFVVTGHGIPQRVIDDAFASSSNFFDQSVECKETQSPFDPKLNSGYEYMTQVRPSTGLADRKESLQITARDGCMDGRWPNDTFKSRSIALMDESHALAGRIMDLLEPRAMPHHAIGMGGTLSGSHTLWSDDGQCTLRYLHYPAAPAEDVMRLREDGHWRAGAHTDWDNVTLLYQRPEDRGLECRANPRAIVDETKEHRWAEVDPVDGGIAVNIGDMLSRWSDGRLYSNLHRVRMPKDDELHPPRSRYSIAYFAQSDRRTLITCRDSEPITAGDYIMSRVRSNFEANFKK